MAQYTVRCVNVDSSSEYDDCRCIESIGFDAKGGGITNRTPAQVYDWVENEGHEVYVVYNGTKTAAKGATHGSTKYVRTESNDTKNDNLLNQQSC